MAKKAQQTETAAQDALVKKGKRVLKSYPAQAFVWINAEGVILFSEKGRAGFIKVER
jgi:hypothetical protein